MGGGGERVEGRVQLQCGGVGGKNVEVDAVRLLQAKRGEGLQAGRGEELMRRRVVVEEVGGGHLKQVALRECPSDHLGGGGGG